MKVEETILLVNEQYEINISSATRIKNVYKLEGDKKDYCLKLVSYEYGHFLFILGVIKHLVNMGFNNTLKLIQTKSGKDYIKYEDKFAYVTEWIEARECNYDNPIDLIIATSTLANLHKKSEAFIVTKEMKPRIYWSKWIENFETRRNEILGFKNKAYKSSEFDYNYLRQCTTVAEKAQVAIENLKKTNYYEKMMIEKKKGGYCHHDYAHHNVLINKNNKAFIIDFDYCILDTHLHDLASLLIRKMKHGRWDVEYSKDIMEVYRTIYPLKQDDIPIMAAFMEFPQDFWQLGIQYYWEEQPWEEQFFLNKLNKIIIDKAGKEEFLQDFKKLKVRW